MSRSAYCGICGVLLAITLIEHASAQPSRPTPPGRTGQGQPGSDDTGQSALPNDPKLLALHKQFLDQASKLADEYVRNKDWEKAKSVYQEVLKLVPDYPAVKQRLSEVNAQLATAQRVEVEVKANESWQDTGVILQTGKPVTIRAVGKWTYVMTAELGPEGMVIPKEFRDFEFGCLVGVIDTGDPQDLEPFKVGAEKSFNAKTPGRLFLRMYDVDPKDNKGSLKVEILGTFDTK